MQSQTIKQRGNSGKCLEINEARDKLRVASCDPENPRQGWKWQFLHLENQALEGSNNSSVAVKSKNSTADEKSPVVVIVDQ